jgi:hypothetical protein
VNRLTTTAGLVLVCAVALLAALLEVLLVPLRSGTVFVPVTVLFAIFGNIALPRAGHVFASGKGPMVAPFAFWLIAVVGLSLTTRPEGDVLVPGGGGDQWVFYGVLLGGAVAGVSSIVLADVPLSALLRPAQRRAVARPRG